MLYADAVTLYATVNNIVDANRLQTDNIVLVEHTRLLGIISNQNMSVT